MGAEMFRFEGKRVLVVGGATGMGAAAAQLAQELGAEITVWDVAEVDYPCARSLRVDLSDKESVEAALDDLEGPVDALFSCAGIADGPDALIRINFIAQRHIVDTLVADGRLGSGSAVGMISSVGGAGWQGNLPTLRDFLANDTWESMERWIAEHDGTNSYVFSKQAMNLYVTSRSLDFAKRGMRINAIMPGGTDTPLAQKHAEGWLSFQSDYRDATGLPHLTPEEMGNVLAFLCMDAAAGVNGALLLVDDGYVGSTIAGAFDSFVIKAILGDAGRLT